MMKLVLGKIRIQMKTLLPVMGVSLVISALWAVFGNMDAMWAQMFSRFLMAAALICCILPLLGSILLSWMDFYNSFYGSRSYLIRTLPFSRDQIYFSCLLSDLICLIISVLWIVCTLWGGAALAAGFEEVRALVDSTDGILWLFVFAMLLQVIFIELCGIGGGIFGYRMNSSKLACSVGYGILIYFIGNLLMSVPLFGLIFQLDGSEAVTIAQMKQVLWLIAGLYLVINAVLIGMQAVLIRGRTDVE